MVDSVSASQSFRESELSSHFPPECEFGTCPTSITDTSPVPIAPPGPTPDTTYVSPTFTSISDAIVEATSADTNPPVSQPESVVLSTKSAVSGGAIAGAAVGGAIALALLAVILLVLFKRRRRQKRTAPSAEFAHLTYQVPRNNVVSIDRDLNSPPPFESGDFRGPLLEKLSSNMA